MSENKDVLIRMNNISKVFLTEEVETHALAQVHLEIMRGEFVAISGPSGCGKSTLLSILGLLDSSTEGSYLLNDKPVAEPVNLGGGWVGLDYEAAFGCPVKVINDAAMQALGSYEGGKMLFLGFGTGLGSAMIVDGIIQPMELGHLPYRKRTYEDYVGADGMKRLGRKKWRRFADDVIEKLTAALLPDYIVLGGGNAEELKTLPPKCRLGDNANAFTGGFRLWEYDGKSTSAGCAVSSRQP